MTDVNWFSKDAPAPSETHRQKAFDRQQTLTKPPGSLGQLETMAIQLASLQNTDNPSLNQAAIHVFAADHGVCAEGVSAFPQVVTGEMIKNFARGGAAISVLASEQSVPLQVHNLGTVVDLPELENVRHYRLGFGTQNFVLEPAMTESQLFEALAIGAQAVLGSFEQGLDLFIGGEMGIGNTTSATALAAALLNRSVDDLVGPGTGLSSDALGHKARIIEQALALHIKDESRVIDQLMCLGGFEIAALVGAYIRSAQLGVAVLVDGFICSVAALVAVRLNPSVRPWLLLSHQSAERGHRHIVNALELEPILNLGMRLGEASGAAMALPVLRLACQLHNHMATFESAGVSTSD